jgi:hypothetical protein
MRISSSRRWLRARNWFKVSRHWDDLFALYDQGAAATRQLFGRASLGATSTKTGLYVSHTAILGFVSPT